MLHLLDSFEHNTNFNSDFLKSYNIGFSLFELFRLKYNYFNHFHYNIKKYYGYMGRFKAVMLGMAKIKFAA